MEKRTKMPIYERSRQFMPFAALKGYEDMVKDSEQTVSEKREISEERAEELSKEISKLKRGDEVFIEYYKDGRYIKKNGIVSNVDSVLKKISVVKEKISFDDIYDIRKVEEQ